MRIDFRQSPLIAGILADFSCRQDATAIPHDTDAPARFAGQPPRYNLSTFAPAIEAVVTSLVMEGVFERFPRLRIVLVESGFVWVPSLCWRLDRLWERMRDEVPHLTRRPSEYIRQNIWYTTQRGARGPRSPQGND